MKYLLILVCFLATLHTNAQKKLVADETWFIKSGTTSFRIITSNEMISNKMIKKFGQEATKVTFTQKVDRKGRYWETSFYFRNEKYDSIAIFINNGFR